MKHIFKNLNDSRQRTCLLLLDVVYVKETLHYHGRIDFRNSVKKLNLLNVRSSRLEVFRRKDVLRNFGKFTGITCNFL